MRVCIRTPPQREEFNSFKENPEKKILHTVQVDRNGFIHALLNGTPLEIAATNTSGERAYERWIQTD